MYAARSHGAAPGGAFKRSDDTRLIPTFKNAPTARFRAFKAPRRLVRWKERRLNNFIADLALNQVARLADQVVIHAL